MARKRELRRRSESLRLAPEDLDSIAAALQPAGVDAEVALLRLLIRRKVIWGDTEGALKGIDTLCTALEAAYRAEKRKLMPRAPTKPVPRR